MGLLRQEHYTPDEIYLSTKLFRTLAHPLRLRILAALLVHETRAVGELARQFNGAQSCISDHMAVLKENHLVIGTHVNNSIQYRLNRQMWDEYRTLLTILADEEQFQQLYHE